MKKNTFKVKVITLFPESFPGVLGVGVIGRALKKKIWSLKKNYSEKVLTIS